MIYHKDIGFPSTLYIPEDTYVLTYSHHARFRQHDRHHLSLVPKKVRVLRSNVIEATTNDDQTTDKVMIRIPYDKKRDICLVIKLLKKNRGIVLTIWLNRKKEIKIIKNKIYDTPIKNTTYGIQIQ